MALHVVLSTSSGVPIYEQIEQQVRAAILSGELAEGEALPSIRGLARDLQISVITTTRAYSDLAQQGYVANVPGKGSFVLPRNTELMREQVLRQIEGHLSDAAHMARLGGVDDAELHTMLDLVLGLGADDQETSHE
ncbi:GntR family transcriptional regulator [Brooklawnia cerclae]